MTHQPVTSFPISFQHQFTRAGGRTSNVRPRATLLVNTPSGTTPLHRHRGWYALAVVLVIGLGLLWRSRLLPLSSFIAKYGGDALWALVVFLGFGFLFTRLSTLRVALLALCFAWSIEFLQLYHAHWIDFIRSSRLGHLVLGSTFNTPDLLAYVVGITIAAIVELSHRSTHHKSTNSA